VIAWSELDDSPKKIRSLLEERGLALKKRWGQNFMISKAARERIVSLAEIEAGERVWEIGSGLGAITSLLVSAARSVTVFEVDHGLAAVIAERFGADVRIVMGDAVETLPEQAADPPQRIIGNLPYRSAAAIISTILESPILHAAVRRMVFTVQREMAARMVARPGSKDYSPLSILCALAGTTKRIGDLSHGNFYPAPDVISSIVTIDPGPRDLAGPTSEPARAEPGLRLLASALARALFQNRRKTIGNNLRFAAEATGYSREELEAALDRVGVAKNERAERVAPERYRELAQVLLG
jgi:16S rRNA (adenine1518-N6/adenine1519-N6)-dimethyltransferase